jgi:hypothetical protein
MEDRYRLDDLKREGRLRWIASERAWVAQPHDVVDALVHDGYAEYKREVARSGRAEAGGMWQGISPTGSVASAIWVQRPTDALVFIDIDGRPVTEAWDGRVVG